MDTAVVITNKAMVKGFGRVSHCHRPLRLSLCSHGVACLLLAFCSSVAFAQGAASQAASAPSQGVDAQPLNAATVSNVIEPGDTIAVTVFNTPELSGALHVDPNGRIHLPVGGALEVNGLTLVEAGVAIENRLRTGQIMLEPHVSVIITQLGTQGVTMFGEVRSPGVYPIRGSSSLYDALSLAGGPSATEGGTISIAHRSDPEHPAIIQVSSSDYSVTLEKTRVVAGDIVLVSKAAYVYIVGDMKTTGQFPMPFGKRFTILQILALTGGPNPTASMSKVSIVRATPTGAIETIRLDLMRIMKNQDPNVMLEASDVLVVPHSGLKQFEQVEVPAALGAAIGIGISAALVK